MESRPRCARPFTALFLMPPVFCGSGTPVPGTTPILSFQSTKDNLRTSPLFHRIQTASVIDCHHFRVDVSVSSVWNAGPWIGITCALSARILDTPPRSKAIAPAQRELRNLRPVAGDNARKRRFLLRPNSGTISCRQVRETENATASPFRSRSVCWRNAPTMNLSQKVPNLRRPHRSTSACNADRNDRPRPDLETGLDSGGCDQDMDG
jgi:hypothetical protein